jgi:hypothetical protein
LSLAAATDNEIRTYGRIAMVDFDQQRKVHHLMMGDDTLLGKVFEFLGSPLLKNRATANAMARPLLQWRAAEGLDGPAYRQEVAKVTACLKAAQDPAPSSLPTFRNPLGNVYADLLSRDMSPTLFRRDNLVADRALLRFALLVILRGETDATAIAAEAKQAGLVHPFTGEAATWDEKSRRLSYTLPSCFGKQKGLIPIAVILPGA